METATRLKLRKNIRQKLDFFCMFLRLDCCSKSHADGVLARGAEGNTTHTKVKLSLDVGKIQ
jgi:hypothetical protein